MEDHVMLKMSVYTARGIQSSSPSTWNECSTHSKWETNVRIVPPMNILKDTGRSQAAAAAAHTGHCRHHPRLGAQLPNPLLSFVDSQGGSPRAVWCETETRRDRMWSSWRRQLSGQEAPKAAGPWGINLPPLTGPAQLPPKATGPPALTQNPPCRCMAGKRGKKKFRKIILQNE